MPVAIRQPNSRGRREDSGKESEDFREISTSEAGRQFRAAVLLGYFRADCNLGEDLAPIQRAILPSTPDAQPLRPEGEN